MMVFLRVPDDVLARSAAFLKLYAVGFLPYCLFQMTINLMRASGESRQPTVFLILSFLINIVLDLVFVGWFHMVSADSPTRILAPGDSFICP